MRALALPRSAPLPISSEIDWGVTIIAAFSLLLHFGIAAGICSDWADPIVDDGLVVGGVLERIAPIAAPIETASDDPTPAPSPTVAPARSHAPTAGPVDRAMRPRGPEPSPSLGQLLERIHVGTIGALGAPGPATLGVLARGSALPLDPLDEAARAADGVDRSSGLRLGAAGGPLVGSTRGAELASIGDTRRAVPSDAGPHAPVAGPTPVTDVSAPDARTTGVPGVERVVAGLRGPFRRCYLAELGDHPDAHGSVRLVAKIGPNGEVLSARAQGGDLGASLVGCLVRRLQAATFAPPESGVATVVIPITFALQR